MHMMCAICVECIARRVYTYTMAATAMMIVMTAMQKFFLFLSESTLT
jgi:hypothetical protein